MTTRNHTNSLSYRRGKKGSEAIVAFLVVLVVTGLTLPLTGWLLMLGIGGLHSGWIPAIPTIGYGSAVVLAWTLGVIGASLKGARATTSKND